MKVLVAHNRYRSDAPSGENKIVDAEIDLLRQVGVDVVPLIEESDRIAHQGATALAEAAMGPFYSPRGVRRFRSLLDEGRPDVVHVHNVFPLISPQIVNVATSRGVPVVHSVHNYRHSCINGLHFRDSRTCMDCLGSRFGVPGIVHACYRGSRLQSTAMSLGHGLHRPTWRKVSAVLALTPLMEDLLVTAGLPRDRITVRPNWVPDPGDPVRPGTAALFVGRLDEAKGIDLLIESWRRSAARHQRMLNIAGDGPMRSMVERAAREETSIVYLGSLDAKGVSQAMARSGFVVLPSMSLEGYPLVMAESFAHGRPVLTVAGGAAASIIDESSGWTTTAPTPAALARALESLSDADIRVKASAARSRYERENSPTAGISSLMAVYEKAIQRAV